MPKINKAHMTGTEIKAIRESLGLTIQDFARILNIKHYQHIQAYERGERSIPDSLEQEIKDIYAEQRQKSGALCDKICKQYRNYDTEDFYLILQPSRPEENAGIRKAFLKMLLKGQPVHMIHFDPVSYNKFLDQTGFEHSEQTMQLWADWYYKNQFYLKRKSEVKQFFEARNCFKWQEGIEED